MLKLTEAKHISKLDYSILNADHLIRRPREETIPAGYKMISFNVKNLFTNGPLDKAIDFLLKKLKDEKEI